MSIDNDPIEEEDKVLSDHEEPEEHDEEDDEKTAKVDSELDEAETDEAREEIRARRRTERKSRGQRNRERVEALERNLQALTEQNKLLQQRVGSIQDANTGSQLAQLDTQIRQATDAAEHFKGIVARSASVNDGKTLAEATEYMIAARNKAAELSAFKDQATRAMNAPKPLDPSVVNRSQDFLARNKWYGGPRSADVDSKVLTAVDNSLAAEGWDPSTDAYWIELENRAKKHLAHRFINAAPVKRQSSPVPGGGSQQSQSGGTSFSLSAERVATIKAAGMWDDPAERQKMIKTYRDYDKQNGVK
jgi:hypothetical protein